MDADPLVSQHAPGRTPALAPAPRAAQVELRAATLYERGFHCGESVLIAVNETAGGRFPPEVMRLASGFCEGIGGSRCLCGALAGAVMAAGLLAGREAPTDRWEPSYEAAAELRERWIEDQHATTCQEVVDRCGGMELPARWAHCTMLVGRTARWVIEIAEREGWLSDRALTDR